MATEDECRRALEILATRISASSGSATAGLGDRRIACRIKDLDVSFVADLRNGALDGVRPAAATDPTPDATLTMTGADLVAIVDGRLKMGTAFASGRLRIDASFRDMLRLRGLF